MKIFLIGLPGSGKTTFGKELADAMKMKFVDLDKSIEESEGMTIPEIFSQHQEAYFRKVEMLRLRDWANDQKDFVMATGGGTPCFHGNMEVMSSAGKTVFLDVPVREIVRRIKHTDRGDRPLLGRIHPDELKDQIELLRTRRLPDYSKASIVLKGDSITVLQLISMIDA